jgi:ABC-2 type transport system ATP-binding protein/lipopolysaccharide transport system ATP-binding protein
MALVDVVDVSIDFPVFDSGSRSVRSSVARLARGARRLDVDRRHVTVHALRDVSFSLRDGDRVGLIGRNGSGKSTLLRVLAGVYEPTLGSAHVEGSRASLLNMVLGVDIDATGHENMLLFGLALGLSRREIEARRQSIAEFTELGEHLNLPVRTYSSGMLLRLGFAVSTAVPRDIILIDEIIGAGDAAFMAKALKRLEDMMAGSRILVVASHATSILDRMCNKAMYLREGKIAFFGATDEAIQRYAAETAELT